MASFTFASVNDVWPDDTLVEVFAGFSPAGAVRSSSTVTSGVLSFDDLDPYTSYFAYANGVGRRFMTDADPPSTAELGIPFDYLGTRVPELDDDGFILNTNLRPGGADRPVLLTYTVPGELAVGAGTARLYLPTDGVIQSIQASVGVAPDGTSVLVDVNKNGTTIFSTQANRPEVAVGAQSSSRKVPDGATFTTGDYLTIDLDQVGSEPNPTVDFVSVGSISATAATVDIARPTTGQEGDVVLVQLRIGSATETVPAITNWTQVGTVTTGGSSRMYYFWHVLGSDVADPGPWAFATGGATSVTWAGLRSCYRGNHLTTPIDSSVISLQSSSTSSWTFADLTTVNDDVTEVLFAGFNTSTVAPVPTSYTSRNGFGTGTTVSRGMGELAHASPGLKTGPAITISPASSGHRARIGLRPAAAPSSFSTAEDLVIAIRYLET